MSFQSSASNLSVLFLVLNSDLDQCKENLKPDTTGYWDRMYVRCLYSLIEGLAYRIRHALISAHEAGETMLNPMEYILLSEVRCRIAKNGEIQKIEEFLPFSTGLRFTFKTCCRVLDSIDCEKSAFSHNGWNCMQESIKVRDRLTHPKEPFDLIVTGHELEVAQKAEKWFLSLVSEIFLRMKTKYS